MVPITRTLRYLGMVMDTRRRFYPYIKDSAARATWMAQAVTKLMPNDSGPSLAKRRLLATVVTSKLLYATDVWCDPALSAARSANTLNAALRTVAIRVIRAYQTVSTEAVLLLAVMIPADILVENRRKVAVRLRFPQQDPPPITPCAVKTEERRTSIVICSHPTTIIIISVQPDSPGS